MLRKKLEGMKVAVLVADGFEQVELTRPVRKLERQGAEVSIISLRPGRIFGMNALLPGKRVRVDKTVFSANPDDYDALFVPGGFINPDLLRQSKRARDFVRAFDEAGKPIATMCHGPWVFASAGLLPGRKMTSWRGIADDVRNAGAEWFNAQVVRDRNLLSSRGPRDLFAFNRAMVSLFAERTPEDKTVIKRPPRWGLRLAAVGAAVAAVLVAPRVAAARA